jgi:hypothetical protein
MSAPVSERKRDFSSVEEEEVVDPRDRREPQRRGTVGKGKEKVGEGV